MDDNKTRSLFTQEITSEPQKKNQIRCMGCMEEYPGEYDLCPNCGYVAGTAPKLKSYLRPGTMLSERYMLGRAIGQGGFGITYIGWDKIENRKVAVKEFFPSALSTREDGETGIICFNAKAEQHFKEGVKKMLDEGNRLSKFEENPNIVNVYDQFEENGTAYIIMEYLDGKNFKEYAEENGGKLDPREAVNMMIPVIAALEEMHKENMIHRDIAPDNIYLCEDGKIKLLDFGSARIAVQDAEKSLSVMLKPGYAPKEQYASRSKQGPWTDVYSVCATIYKLITGESPVESIERETTALKTFESFGITDCNDIEEILIKGLEPEPENRIRTAQELMTKLLSVLKIQETAVQPAAPLPTANKKAEKNKGKEKPIAIIIAAVVALLVLGGLITCIVLLAVNSDDEKIDVVEETTTAPMYVYGGNDTQDSSKQSNNNSGNEGDNRNNEVTPPTRDSRTTARNNQPQQPSAAAPSNRPAATATPPRTETTTRYINRTLTTGNNRMYFENGASGYVDYTFRPSSAGYYIFESNNTGTVDLNATLYVNGTPVSFNEDFSGNDFKVEEKCTSGSNVTLKVGTYNNLDYSGYIDIYITYISEAEWVAQQMGILYCNNGIHIFPGDKLYYNKSSSSGSFVFEEGVSELVNVSYNYTFSNGTLWLEIYLPDYGYYYYPITIDSTVISDYNSFISYKDSGIYVSSGETVYYQPGVFGGNMISNNTMIKTPKIFFVRNGVCWYGFDTSTKINGEDKNITGWVSR